MALGTTVLASGRARADDFPARPITLVVPVAAGGATDTLARLIAREAAASLGQRVVVDNRGGDTGLIGAASVARAAPDGYTLLMASAAQVTIPPWVDAGLTFDPPRDLAPVAHLVDTPMLLMVAAQSPFRTVDDFVTAARANRGGLNYASTGVGTISHLAMEALKLAADIDVVHVPYRRPGPALNDLRGNQVQAMFTSAESAVVLVDAGQLRALAVTTPERSPLVADVPTMAEAGWPTAEVAGWAGVMAPAKLPLTFLHQLERAFVEAALAPGIQAKLARLGADPVGNDAEQFADVLARDSAMWRRVALASGVRVE